MTKQAMELAILGLLLQTEPDFEVLSFDPTEGLTSQVEDLGAPGALTQMAGHGDPLDVVDHLWMAHALVLGSRLGDADVEEPLHALARALLSPWALDDPDRAASDLVEVVRRARVGEPLAGEVLDGLLTAGQGKLAMSGTADDDQVTLSGELARLATLLLELATNDLSCRSSVHDVEVGGAMVPATFVEVDACTNRSFDQAKRGIDPRRWPDVNPFFVSVTPKGPLTTEGPSWAGVVQEVVGPGLNGSVYTTDLSVTYTEHPKMAVTAFDLAPVRKDDGRVSVDRGMVALTDEGAHRRLRTLKVYRIEDLDTPLSWVCPLWSQQVVLASWWSV